MELHLFVEKKQNKKVAITIISQSTYEGLPRLRKGSAKLKVYLNYNLEVDSRGYFHVFVGKKEKRKFASIILSIST